MHKTGTTSLQNLLLAEAALLRRHGYRVLVNPAQVVAKDPRRFDPQWLGEQASLARRGDLDIEYRAVQYADRSAQNV